MDLDTRIRRRLQQNIESRIIVDAEALSPVAHIEEPVGRGSIFEQLLDYVQPSLSGRLPQNAYIWGPTGAGKTAIVTALFSKLDTVLSGTETVVYTTTRAQETLSSMITYLNARELQSKFQFYHALLDGLTDESIPNQGISTEHLWERIDEEVDRQGVHALVAVDHVEEYGTFSLQDLTDLFEPFESNLAWIAIGRDPPANVAAPAAVPQKRIEIPPYEQQVMVDLLMTRASNGLARHAIEHAQARHIASWADGNAHDALAALFGAAISAEENHQSQLREEDVRTGMDAVPQPCVVLGRLLTLPQNRQAVLRQLLDCDRDVCQSVTTTAEAIADAPGIDLSVGTVTRFLYELAEEGIIERIETESQPNRKGRPPSRVVPRFPTLVFRYLYDRRRS